MGLWIWKEYFYKYSTFRLILMLDDAFRLVFCLLNFEKKYYLCTAFRVKALM